MKKADREKGRLEEELEKALAKPRWNGSSNMGKVFQRPTGDVDSARRNLKVVDLETRNSPYNF